MKCPDCQFENIPTASRCGNCGKPLTISRQEEKSQTVFSIPEGVKPLNFLFQIIPMIAMFITLIPGIIMTIEYWEYLGAPNSTESIGLVLCAVGGILLLVYIVYSMIILYRAWQILQHGLRETTPGKAVGFLFIPFFNFYWIFVAYRKWAVCLNNNISMNGAELQRVNENMYLTYAILNVAGSIIGMIPFLNFLSGIASIVTIIIFMIISKQMCDTVNRAIQTYGPNSQMA